MTFSNPIVAAGLAGLGELYAARAVTPVEACEVYLSRLEGLDGALSSLAAIDAPGARRDAEASARRWREGVASSGLDGAPVLIEARFAVEGLDGVGGRAPFDASAVRRLRAAGAVVLGLARADGDWRPTHDPWSFDAPASGAAAAVAAGFAAGALGVEAVGGLAAAASRCGVFAHKPTPGLCPSEGAAGCGWTFDQPSVMARSLRDVARLFGAICAGEPDVATEIAEPASPEALANQAPTALAGWGAPSPATTRWISIARGAGLAVEPLDFAALDLAGLCADATFVRATEIAAGAPDDILLVELSAGAAPHARSARDLARAYRRLADAAEAVRDAMSPFAGLITPATPAYAVIAALAGLPATSFPIGLDSERRPQGAIAAAWDDETTLGLARLLAADLGAPPDYRG